MNLKRQKERSMKWITDNLFKLNAKDIMLWGTSINPINKNKIEIILTSKTGNYSDKPLITITITIRIEQQQLNS